MERAVVFMGEALQTSAAATVIERLRREEQVTDQALDLRIRASIARMEWAV